MFVICGKIQINWLWKKYRICESSVAKFREATSFSQDNVHTRTCDLQYSCKVFGADLYYHQVYLPAYVNNRTTNKNNNKTEVKATERDTFNLYLQFFKSLFDSGISISEIRDMIND